MGENTVLKEAIERADGVCTFPLHFIDASSSSYAAAKTAGNLEKGRKFGTAMAYRLLEAGHVAMEEKDAEIVPLRFTTALRKALQNARTYLEAEKVKPREQKRIRRTIRDITFLVHHPSEAFQAVKYWLDQKGLLR